MAIHLAFFVDCRSRQGSFAKTNMSSLGEAKRRKIRVRTTCCVRGGGAVSPLEGSPTRQFGYGCNAFSGVNITGPSRPDGVSGQPDASNGR